jgi:DNA helicase-2/ATP-dependent DNA helicase PcrA
MKSIPFEQALNPEQYAAALAGDGPLLVLAAAGTGKTRTLVYRVAHLVERGVDPNRILLLTFTNRAAREMLERACALVNRNVSGLWGGTFHHMANRILRAHAGPLGYPADYTILDRDDSLSLVRGAIKTCGLQDADFPKPEVVASVFSAAANTERPLAEIAALRFARHPVAAADLARVQRAYREKKSALGAMDFDDLLTNGLKLFREHGDILRRYQERFLYVLVDEYQDTNVIQAEWVDLIAAAHRNLLVVGDDFQSIYSWRGADYRNIMSFPQRYPDARLFKLETNYRSVPEILEVANACIAGNPEQFQKTLRSVRETYRCPVVARVRDGERQGVFIAAEIRRLLRNGYRPADIAVLYRAHFHALELQMVLTRAGIPFVITSGARFFEQAHIKDVCALLRLLQNPGDELAFKRLLALLPKVGPRTADRVWEQLGRRFRAALAEDRRQARAALPKMALNVWDEIEPLLAAYRGESLAQNPAEIIRRFLNMYYERYASNTFENFERRLEDLQELANFTTRFASVEQFLSEVALLTNLDAETANDSGAPRNAVRLSTIHQAKGLEWGAVFVLWVTEGLFPSARAIAEAPDMEAEERRLFYVAVTRAKDELFFCVPEVRRSGEGKLMHAYPSRFLREIPPALLQEHRFAACD